LKELGLDWGTVLKLIFTMLDGGMNLINLAPWSYLVSYICWIRIHFDFGKGKGKVYPRTGHEGPGGKWMCSSTLSLTWALNGVGGQGHAPATLPRERSGTHCIGGWVAPRCCSGRVRKIFSPTGIRSTDRPARS
jgi:hypothetical protein